MLPNFLVMGAQKSGTTSLHKYLAEHPEIYLPAQKETKFFVEDERFAKGISHYEGAYFSSREKETAIGEVDPDYMYFPCAVERMREHLDLATMKFIFILRNPVERAFSHYLMTYRRGIENLSFSEALNCEQDRIASGPDANMHYSYSSRGFYMRQIEIILKHVDKTQMLFLLTDDLRTHPRDCLRRVYEFLDVSNSFLPSNLGTEFHRSAVPYNMTLLRRIIGGDTIEKHILRMLVPSKRIRIALRDKLLSLNLTTRHDFRLPTEIQDRLAAMFRGENARLGEFIGRDLTCWHQPGNGN